MIQEASKQQELEEIKWYNPPLPHYYGSHFCIHNHTQRKWKVVEWTGYGWNICSSCGQSGYQNIKLVFRNTLVMTAHHDDDDDNYSDERIAVVCLCGYAIA